MLGALSLASNLLVKKIPVAQFNFMNGIDLEHVNSEERINRVSKWFDTKFEALKKYFLGSSQEEEENLDEVNETLGFEKMLDISNYHSESGV